MPYDPHKPLAIVGRRISCKGVGVPNITNGLVTEYRPMRGYHIIDSLHIVYLQRAIFTIAGEEDIVYKPPRHVIVPNGELFEYMDILRIILESGAYKIVFCSRPPVTPNCGVIYICIDHINMIEVFGNLFSSELHESTITQITFDRVRSMLHFPLWMNGIRIQHVTAIQCPHLVGMWITSPAITSLERFSIFNCPNFKAIPRWLNMCPMLTRVVLRGVYTNANVNRNALYGCTALKSVMIHDKMSAGIMDPYSNSDLEKKAGELAKVFAQG